MELMSSPEPLCGALAGFTLVRFLVFYMLANRFPNHRTVRTYKPEYSQTKVDVNIHRDADVRMPHEVLQGLGVHPGSCLVAAVGVAANVWGNVRHLHPEDFIGNVTDRRPADESHQPGAFLFLRTP